MMPPNKDPKVLDKQQRKIKARKNKEELVKVTIENQRDLLLIPQDNTDESRRCKDYVN